MRLSFKMIRLLGLMAAAVVLVLAAVVLLNLFSEKIILRLPEDYYFYELHPVAEKCLIYLIVIPVVTLLAVVGGRRKRTDEAMQDMYPLYWIWRRLTDIRLLLTAVWLLSLYCCFFSATVVTEDEIICHSPLHPSGIIYDYKDVTQIRTGFGQKRFAFLEYQKKGEFYYEIELGGKRKVFYVPSVNDEIKRYEDETYLELEEFDQSLVSLGIPKKAEEKGWEDCDLDQEYVERFRRIISTVPF